jgi:hypothetical protein
MTISRSKDSDRSGAPTASIVLGDHANSSMIIENLKSSERRDRAIAKKISWFLKNRSFEKNDTHWRDRRINASTSKAGSSIEEAARSVRRTPRRIASATRPIPHLQSAKRRRGDLLSDKASTPPCRQVVAGIAHAETRL